MVNSYSTARQGTIRDEVSPKFVHKNVLLPLLKFLPQEIEHYVL